MSNLKRGLSPIIASLMILLLGIIISSIIWASLKPTLLSPQNSCLISKIDSQIKIESVCYNEQEKETILKISRKIGENQINSLIIETSNALEKTSWLCSDSCSTCAILQEGQTKEYYLPNDKPLAPIVISITSEGCLLDNAQIKPCI